MDMKLPVKLEWLESKLLTSCLAPDHQYKLLTTKTETIGENQGWVSCLYRVQLTWHGGNEDQRASLLPSSVVLKMVTVKRIGELFNLYNDSMDEDAKHH